MSPSVLCRAAFAAVAAAPLVIGAAACARRSAQAPAPTTAQAPARQAQQPQRRARAARSSLRAENLRCEYYTSPRGIDVPSPCLSWELADAAPARGQRQSAYQVRVATSASLLERGRPDLWDSGQVASDATLQVPYAGKPLTTAQQCFWQVRAWDQDGAATAWSPPASWTMGVLDPADWHAQWIAPEEGPGPRQRLGIGYHAKEAKGLDEIKWVQLDLGESVPIEQVVLWPVRDHYEYATFGFPARFRVEASDELDFTHATVVADLTAADFSCPPDGPVVLPSRTTGAAKGDGPPSARFVRVTAVRLFPRRDGVGCFALSELEVMSHGKALGRGRPVSALDSVEAHGWTLPALTDGVRQPEHTTVLMRRDVALARHVRRATALVCGLGQYELTIDGQKVGDAWITPGWTQYQKTSLYDTYDVTTLLNSDRSPRGVHALGLRLGTGMYDMTGDTRSAQQQRGQGAPRAIMQILLEYTNGSSALIVTDPSWRWRDGPTTYSGVFGGEDFDARLDPVGWDLPGFDDSRWETAVAVPAPSQKLAGLSRGSPPITVHGVRTPISTSTPRLNTLVYDLGQNAPYVPRLTVRGKPGTTVQLWPAEIRRPDGTIDQTTIRAGKHISYTLRGSLPAAGRAGVGLANDADETYYPRFWYVGSRYWQATATDITGKPIDPATVIRKFEGLLVHSDSTPVGTFECSDQLFNKTRDLILWAMRSNLASVITDCPHREKSGWLEQIHLNAPGLMYSFDMAPLFRKTMEDMGDAQQDDGMVPTMAPEYFIYEKGYRDSIEWGGTCIYLPGYMSRWYADSTQIARHYDQMSRYMGYLATLARDHMISTGLGDWDGYGPDKRTPVALTDTAYYYRAATILQGFARQLGHEEDEKKWAALAGAIKDSFNTTLLDAASGQYATGSQSCQATALDLGLVPSERRDAAMQRLLEDIEAQRFGISCGEVGHPSLLRVLQNAGRSDLIYKIHHQSERPGYGYQLAKGATTLTEAWDASPISHNHFMLGHIMEWFYAGLAGIRPDNDDPAGAGFMHFIIRPEPVADITWAKASYRSIRGEIRSEWHKDGDRFSLDVSVPPNTEATVYVPATSLAAVTEQGRPAAAAEGVKSAAMEESRAVLRVGSGRYHFESKP